MTTFDSELLVQALYKFQTQDVEGKLAKLSQDVSQLQLDMEVQFADLKQLIASLGSDPAPEPEPEPEPEPMPEPEPGPAEEHLLFDFSDGVLHDYPWMRATYTTVDPNNPLPILSPARSYFGSGEASQLTVEPGIGKDGSYGMRCKQTDWGDPRFYVTIWPAGGNTSYRDERGYILPRQAQANVLEMVVRFEVEDESEWPDNEGDGRGNFHIGTFCFDPAKLSSNIRVVETDNWHFYQWTYIPLAVMRSGQWIRIRWSNQPRNQRSGWSDLRPKEAWGKMPCWRDPTQGYIPSRWTGTEYETRQVVAGDLYYHCMTRFYVSPVFTPANRIAEHRLFRPSMIIDSMRLIQDPQQAEETAAFHLNPMDPATWRYPVNETTSLPDWRENSWVID